MSSSLIYWIWMCFQSLSCLKLVFKKSRVIQSLQKLQFIYFQFSLVSNGFGKSLNISFFVLNTAHFKNSFLNRCLFDNGWLSVQDTWLNQSKKKTLNQQFFSCFNPLLHATKLFQVMTSNAFQLTRHPFFLIKTFNHYCPSFEMHGYCLFVGCQQHKCDRRRSTYRVHIC